ncbi:MAG: aminoglycoside phosphotransferase family protein [Dehalococcoidia bacterium]|nr:aminoglycoside phosphotransferase family protein [Dehalococcoidia bacterium]
MAGLDTLPDGVTIARLVKDVTGAEPRGARSLGAGVATIAWRVETDGDPVVVLVQKPDAARTAATEGIGDFAPRYGAQCAIFDRLHPIDARVPKAIAWSGDPEHAGVARFELPWAMVSEARGAPGEAAALTSEGARDLGELLARLHELSGEGFGLTVDRRDRLQGGSPDMATGLLERWPNLWPFDGTSLIAHPVARLAPRLIEPASRFREALLRFGELRRGTLVHGDLNPQHLFLEGGRLGTLIDFGDAFVGPAAADFATFASHYGHYGSERGWEGVERVLEGYAASTVLRETRLAEAQLFGVALGLYRIRKRVALQQPAERIARDVAFLEGTIDVAGRLLRG